MVDSDKTSSSLVLTRDSEMLFRSPRNRLPSENLSCTNSDCPGASCFDDCVVELKHGRLRFPSSGFFNRRNRRDGRRCAENGTDSGAPLTVWVFPESRGTAVCSVVVGCGHIFYGSTRPLDRFPLVAPGLPVQFPLS